MSIGSQCMTLTISIHALREEGDAPPPAPPAARGDFYPRPPRGGRQYNTEPEKMQEPISIHALREEGDAGPDLTRTRGV